jgi:hypothetical protein
MPSCPSDTTMATLGHRADAHPCMLSLSLLSSFSSSLSLSPSLSPSLPLSLPFPLSLSPSLPLSFPLLLSALYQEICFSSPASPSSKAHEHPSPAFAHLVSRPQAWRHHATQAPAVVPPRYSGPGRPVRLIARTSSSRHPLRHPLPASPSIPSQHPLASPPSIPNHPSIEYPSQHPRCASLPAPTLRIPPSTHTAHPSQHPRCASLPAPTLRIPTQPASGSPTPGPARASRPVLHCSASSLPARELLAGPRQAQAPGLRPPPPPELRAPDKEREGG